MPNDPREHLKAKLGALVDTFERHHDEYMRPDYSEADVRSEFIDPLFEALGWDVQNRAGASPKERDVIREKGETHGRVDYTFRLEGRTAFFVEAKAPHVPLDRVDVVMQAKSYAWHSRDVFIAAVTDFEEFHLYDATAKPDRKHPNAGLIFSYRYTDYLKPKALDDLWLLSRQAVAAGSIDQLLKKSSVQARQRIPVDQAFLDDLSAWREQLAKAVFKAHPHLSPADLNTVVQVFLDRLIFIRICEDRRIMAPRRLIETAENWEYSGKRVSLTNDLNALFREVNDRLNGEIFKPQPCEKIDWDINAALVVDIIKHLYFPASPYMFDKIPVELLGSIYERYLGKTIRVTATRAIVEDKPEVRKAGGVYYTPKYIVDYIIEQTVGKLIEGKAPKQIASLRFLDPACGSGSFLLGAYQKLLDHHKQYYAEQAGLREADAAQPRLVAAEEGGELKLSLDEKAAILRDNIFGVDIDPQAVEITMMSLYIKMLEDERRVLEGRALLPRLRDNIKCGNSLVGYDIGELDDVERARINPFDWNSKSEGFGEILATGGFDAVIGNPPYIDSEWMTKTNPELREYCSQHYDSASGNWDIFCVFVDQALRLCRKNGLSGMIVPNKILSADYARALRCILSQVHTVINLRDYSSVPVFPVSVYPIVYIAVAKHRDFVELLNVQEMAAADGVPTVAATRSVKWERVTSLNGESWSTVLRADKGKLVERIENNAAQLGKIATVNGAATVAEAYEYRGLLAEYTPNQKHYLALVNTGTLDRYIALWGDRPTKYIKSTFRKPIIPQSRWSRLSERRLRQAQSPKIIVGGMTKTLECVYDSGHFIAGKSTTIVISNSLNHLYLLGLLNSRLITYYYQKKFAGLTLQGGFLRIGPPQLKLIPIHIPAAADKARHDKMVALVERMLELHKQKQAAKSDTARERIEREIKVTDEQIDALVYELYGLTEEEIKIVEA